MCYQISHIISHLSYNIKRLYYLAEKRLMFSYNLMQFSTISLSFYDLLQIFRNCLGNLFFLIFFLFFGWVQQRDRTGTGDRATYFVYIYLTSFALRRDVAMSRWAVPLSLCLHNPASLPSPSLFAIPLSWYLSVSWCVLPFRWRPQRCMSSTTSSAEREECDANYVSVFDSSSNYDGLCLLLLPSCCFIVQTW